MACPSVTTGDRFLVETLSHLDCQAQALGSFGFQSLASAGSPAASVLTALLTLFIALYALRLLFAPTVEPRDLVTSVLKIGIVLTLAASWPAFKTLAYDTVLHAPAEVASAITPSTMPSTRAGLAERLQAIDSGIAALTYSGTGRQTGQRLDEDVEGSFRSVALSDEAGLGWSRPLFLASTIGPLALLRIAAGLLLALAPIVAGLLLFDFSRGIFAGWVRGLALTALGSLGITLLLSVEVAVLEPWLADVLNHRNLGYAVPTAPTELLALVLAFAAAGTGLLVLLSRVAFHNAWSLRLPTLSRGTTNPWFGSARVSGSQPELLPAPSRAIALSEIVAEQVRRESGGSERVRRIELQPAGLLAAPSGGMAGPAPEPLGSSYRRTLRRDSASQRKRDLRS